MSYDKNAGQLGSQEYVALKLLEQVRESDRNFDLDKKQDRDYILSSYAECLRVVRGQFPR